MTLTMNWAAVWTRLFGTTTLWGLDLGFWAALAAVALIVITRSGVSGARNPPAPRPEKKETVKRNPPPPRDPGAGGLTFLIRRGGKNRSRCWSPAGR